MGAGADPTVGEAAANGSRDEIREAKKSADMVFVTIGAGGGTGSGAGYVVAEVARERCFGSWRALDRLALVKSVELIRMGDFSQDAKLIP